MVFGIRGVDHHSGLKGRMQSVRRIAREAAARLSSVVADASTYIPRDRALLMRR
ncbi:MAG: hypothetical protein K8R59_06315 [Thermoanaerobaculales bacterium]|nr:hypothetical protein [Thermoanaerobaculales bacterium]